MKVLDLFCGVGGASCGYFNAGFDVVGVDSIKTNYPFEFINKDVFDLPLSFFSKFDLIHASPPCQGYIMTNKDKPNYPRLVNKTRWLLEQTNKPYVIENIQTAPLRKDLFLCGVMFNLKILRHRIFELKGFSTQQPKHPKHKGQLTTGEYIGVYSGSKGNPTTRKRNGKIKDNFQNQKQAIQIFWAKTEQELFNAIPPRYTEFIGSQFKEIIFQSLRTRKLKND